MFDSKIMHWDFIKHEQYNQFARNQVGSNLDLLKKRGFPRNILKGLLNVQCA